MTREIERRRARRARWVDGTSCVVMLAAGAVFVFFPSLKPTDEWGVPLRGRGNSVPVVVVAVLFVVQASPFRRYTDGFRRGADGRTAGPASGRQAGFLVGGVALDAGSAWALTVGTSRWVTDRAQGVTTGVPHVLGLSREGAFGVIVGLATVVAVLHIVCGVWQAVATRRENEVLAALDRAERKPDVLGIVPSLGRADGWSDDPTP